MSNVIVDRVAVHGENGSVLITKDRTGWFYLEARARNGDKTTVKLHRDTVRADDGLLDQLQRFVTPYRPESLPTQIKKGPRSMNPLLDGLEIVPNNSTRTAPRMRLFRRKGTARLSVSIAARRALGLPSDGSAPVLLLVGPHSIAIRPANDDPQARTLMANGEMTVTTLIERLGPKEGDDFAIVSELHDGVLVGALPEALTARKTRKAVA